MFGRSKPNPKDAIKSFRSVTGASEKVAEVYCKRSGYDVERAIDDFYATGGSLGGASTSSVNKKNIEALFDKYKKISIEGGGDEDSDVVQVPGIVQLAADLGVDVEDIIVLIVAWKMECKTPYSIARSEWNAGMADMSVDTIEGLKARLPSLRSEISAADKFKSFYNFCFDFCKAPGARSLPPDAAIDTFAKLLKGRYKHLDLWLEFLKTVYNKAVGKDTWQQFLEFTRTIDESFSNYDTDGAWPIVLDDFVDYAKPKIAK
eukprot:TRINITY_DN920_c0_g1_i1.p1 TRINITY_DN920_c0_g1~~TRINITY_DN920_c0_g1_i1.p1  ORF type:complete len:280 (+),score=105.98 TRINITY_DN920_c0_g1_i1:60-842(+)